VNDRHGSWLLDTIETASHSNTWDRTKLAATGALIGLGAWLATLLVLAVATGPASIPTLLWLALLAVVAVVDQVVGRRTAQKDATAVRDIEGDHR
jgi:hypothetical protein